MSAAAAPVRAGNPWLWLPRQRPGRELRLLCLAYAGGRPQVFSTWPSLLPPDVEVAAVELPGRGPRTRERPRTRVRPLVDELATAIESDLDTPYAIFGHSLGALLGFELAREVRARGLPSPLALLVASSPAPHLPMSAGSLAELAESAVAAQLEELGAPRASSLTAEAQSLLLPYLRADLELYDSYAYEAGEPLDCPVSAYGGRFDAVVAEADLAAWAEQTTASFGGVRLLPGDHFFLHAADGVLVQAVARELERLR